MYPTFLDSPSYCSAPRAVARAGFSAAWGNSWALYHRVLKHQCKAHSPQGETRGFLVSKTLPHFGPISRLLRKFCIFNVASKHVLCFLSVNSRSVCFRTTCSTNTISRCEDTATFPFYQPEHTVQCSAGSVSAV